jgi:WD40 repeat protein
VFVIGIWDAETGEDKGVMPDDPEHIEHTASISSLAFSADGRLATASLDHSIRLWDFNTRQRTATLQGHLSEARLVTFAPDGRTLVSAGADGVKIWPANPQQKEGRASGDMAAAGLHAR